MFGKLVKEPKEIEFGSGDIGKDAKKGLKKIEENFSGI